MSKEDIARKAQENAMRQELSATLDNLKFVKANNDFAFEYHIRRKQINKKIAKLMKAEKRKAKSVKFWTKVKKLIPFYHGSNKRVADNKPHSGTPGDTTQRKEVKADNKAV
jgi:hypothetical protein